MNPAEDAILTSVGLKSYHMSLSINLAQRSFNELLKTCLGHHGLTIPQWLFLGAVYDRERVRPVIVAKQLNIKPSYIAKLIHSLEAEDLVCSYPFPDDERGKTIGLTEKGLQLVQRVEPLLAECLEGQLGPLPNDDVATYFSLSSYIAEHVHHH